jgi:hypothetical protein
MENDVINLDEMCKILNKSHNTVRKCAKDKKIPARKICDEWYSSRLALSMYAAGYDPREFYEQLAKKVLKKSTELFI